MANGDAPAARDRFKWIERLALATLGAAVAYVALRTASLLFYGALGVTPEELGAGELDLLARSVGLLVVVLAVSATIAAAVAWLFASVAMIGLWDLVLGPASEDLTRAPIPYRGVVIAAGLVALGLGVWRQNLLALGPLVIYPLGGWIGSLVWARRPDVRSAEWRSGPRLWWRRLRSLFGVLWRPAMAVAVVLGLAVASIVVTSAASSAAAAVQQGQAYRQWTVPWRAEPATVRWLTRPASDPLAGRCLMYLGQSNAVLVLYDVGAHRVVRVPSGEVVLLVDTTAPTCSQNAATSRRTAST